MNERRLHLFWRSSCGSLSHIQPPGAPCQPRSEERASSRVNGSPARRSARSVLLNTHMECGLSTAHGLFGPLVCGVWVGGGSASAVVDVCVATHMRGLVPHDRCAMVRSGAVLW